MKLRHLQMALLAGAVCFTGTAAHATCAPGPDYNSCVAQERQEAAEKRRQQEEQAERQRQQQEAQAERQRQQQEQADRQRQQQEAQAERQRQQQEQADRQRQQQEAQAERQRQQQEQADRQRQQQDAQAERQRQQQEQASRQRQQQDAQAERQRQQQEAQAERQRQAEQQQARLQQIQRQQDQQQQQAQRQQEQQRQQAQNHSPAPSAPVSTPAPRNAEPRLGHTAPAAPQTQERRFGEASTSQPQQLQERRFGQAEAPGKASSVAQNQPPAAIRSGQQQAQAATAAATPVPAGLPQRRFGQSASNTAPGASGLVRSSVQNQAATTLVTPKALQSPTIPPAHTPGPITVRFTHVSNSAQGSARVVSNPPGIDCPSVCSANFNGPVAFTVTAASNSIITGLTCFISDGFQTPLKPGNTASCGYPAPPASWGGGVVVDVMLAGSAHGPPSGNGLPPSSSSSPPKTTFPNESRPGAGSSGGCDYVNGVTGRPTGGDCIIVSGNGNSGGGAQSGGNGQFPTCYAQGRDICVAPIKATCVSSFYDKSEYGWFAFQNNCGVAIALTFVALNGSGRGGGALGIGAGNHASSGLSPTEIAALGGGYWLYVCPKGYRPLTPAGSVPTTPRQTYTCHPQ